MHTYKYKVTTCKLFVHNFFFLPYQDKRSVESVCLCFARLVDNYQNDRRILKEIAVQGLLTYIQQLVSHTS
ncbi:hypothetical protein DPMN_136238 [Dreissena polymorpha]|uniref:Uncharacterized protein n=1 Tax=Dreissena polymorpha TaxID=45954 RepID=A0A9D4JDK9_DREPO|nr:hypothetical protein DPMN_136238 [Dreissena polymorpha]